MRKLPINFENPIDTQIVNLGDKLNPYFHKLHLTPNGLTTFSLAFGLFSAFLIVNNQFILAGIFFFIAYMFDCFDGNYARHYNMISLFGDYYDHFADLTKFIVVFYVLYLNNSTKLIMLSPLLIFLFALSGTFIGCQEIYYNNTTQSPSLSPLKKICPIKHKNQHKALQYLRYFGLGTSVFIFSMIIACYDKI
jgi:phosphatidylglycerophosphate synthase